MQRLNEHNIFKTLIKPFQVHSFLEYLHCFSCYIHLHFFLVWVFTLKDVGQLKSFLHFKFKKFYTMSPFKPSEGTGMIVDFPSLHIKWYFLCVHSHVSLHGCMSNEGFTTMFTFIGFLSCVNAFMFLKITGTSGYFTTTFILIEFLSSGISFMS